LPSFIHYLEEDSSFEKLFKISNKRGLTYWKNYTRARFVGVQKEGEFSANQVMVIAGIPTVVVLLLIWISDQAIKATFRPLALLSILLLVPFFYTIGALVPILCQKFYHKVIDLLVSIRALATPSSGRGESTSANWFFPIKGGGILVSIIGLFGSLIYLTKIYKNQSAVYISKELFELCFWIIISYYIGTGAWSILEIPVYILKGVEKIPMNLDPLDRYKNLAILERLGRASIIGMVTLFVLALSLSVCQVFAPTGQRSGWIVVWAQAAFIGLYVVTAIILNGAPRMQLILKLIIYTLLQICLWSATSQGLLTQILPSLGYKPFGGPLHLYQYLSLALFGLFSSYIFYLQILEINNILKSLREKYKNQKLQLYRGLIDDIETQLHKVKNHSNQVEESENRQTLLESINTLINIIDKINIASVDKSGYRQMKGFFAITGVMSPFMSAIIIPIIINYLTQFIPKP